MIIFDLDDTLYHNKALSQRNTELTKKWIKEELNLSKKELESLYRELPEEYPNPLKGIKSLGLSTQGYYDNVFRRIEPDKYLSQRPELGKELKNLERDKVVVSFAPENYCQRVLGILGIDHHFKDVFSASDFNSSKRRVYRNLKNPEIVVGDNYRADLEPAVELGINIIHISESCGVEKNHCCCNNIMDAVQTIRQK